MAFFILAEPIQITLFQRGEFTMQDAHLSAYALMSMAVGIPAFVVGKAFVTVLFAHQDTKAAVKIAATTAITSTGLGFLFVQLSKMFFPAHLDVLGVISCAFSTSIAGWVNVALLHHKLRERGQVWIDDACKKNTRSLIIAAAAMAVVLLALMQFVGQVFMADNHLYRLAAMALVSGLGASVYIILSFRLGALKLADVKSFLSRAPKDKDTTVPVVGDV